MNQLFGEQVSILMIEDQQAEVDFVRAGLKKVRGVDFEIIHTERLAEGLRYLERGRADVLLLDLCLPDSVGYATFERAHQVIQKVPVILLTNMNDENQAMRAVREGAQDYLIKRQLDGELLARSIRYAIARFRADEALRTSQERYALAVQGSNDGVWDWDLRTGNIYFSTRWWDILGCPQAETDGTIDSWLERVHADDVGELRRLLDEHLTGGSPQFSFEYRLRAGDDSYRWVLSRGLAFRADGAKPVRMAGSLTDITRRKEIEERLVQDALFDRLTGLANRNLLLDRLSMAVRKFQGRERTDFALLFLDVDRFKNVNDSLGHTIGDELLRHIGAELTATIRPEDTVARFGGDEFAVLLSDIAKPAQVIHVAERVLAACSRRFEIEGNEVQTTVSIGIALASGGYTSAHDVLRDADIALHWAKGAGKARYQLFDSEMHHRVVALRELEMDLRRALERDEFVMHYQPIVSLTGEGLIGFEALIRWNHPRRGTLAPGEFIDAAEETGLIVPIGWWTLQESCRQARHWQRKFPRRRPITVSVNMSSKLFGQPGLVGRLRDILEESELSPGTLCLEITESVLLRHAEEALERFGELRQLGVCLQVDDFGTGFSSLSYLQKFSYDGLKIDRSFVSGVAGSTESSVIVETVISLGRRLGMNIIAEGVENPDQLKCLKELECPQAQGHLFSRPLDSEATEALLANSSAWSQRLAIEGGSRPS
jgi:diguanylate cyclase (GGDEF)-like protein/PAS domain S-box-containing protein